MVSDGNTETNKCKGRTTGKIYLGSSGDFIHRGVIYIIEQAAAFGEVIIGYLTNATITEFKLLPISNFGHKKSSKKYQGCECSRSTT